MLESGKNELSGTCFVYIHFCPLEVSCMLKLNSRVLHNPAAHFACFWEGVVLVVLPCCIGARGDKLWMQRKSCKICCIFHYLHVKGHKSSSVKSAIKQ